MKLNAFKNLPEKKAKGKIFLDTSRLKSANNVFIF